MAINISHDLSIRYELLSQSIGIIEKKIELLPAGRVNTKHISNNNYYYLAGLGAGEIYLGPQDSALISDLVQKDYLKRVLKQIKCERSAIEKMQKLYPETIAEDVFDTLSDARKQYARPINVCDDAYAEKWMAVPYKRKPFKKDAPEFYTLKGERVRSKSEVIIADRLRAQGIPYRYECPLKVGNRIIHPDFTILRMSDRKILYHEHCGKMNDPQYTEDLIIRAKDYNRTGIILGDKLFFTFESETTPLDMTMLDNIISQHYR